ncbi:hypothetical protein [Treponema pedis]|uniref:hypothetical protein n=1 Tax=Treponema pedis TaxID=409322 RepID=UPI000467D836|nr:hypothetical protein [Treponema pedis]
MIEDDTGKLYDIEMQIIFFCTFDYLDKGLPMYTITPPCTETGQSFNDGTTKIIINSKADGEELYGLNSY